MTTHEQAVEAVAQALLSAFRRDTDEHFLTRAVALVAQITPLLTADLQAKLDAAEARERQAVGATLDAAHEYLVAVYGHSPLAHRVDRARIAAIRTGAKP